VSARPTAAERLTNPDALLSRTDLRELGLERRAVDAVFRALPVVELPGYSRPLIRVEDYRRLLAESTYGPDRVRPCGSRRQAANAGGGAAAAVKTPPRPGVTPRLRAVP
jgi:hypothetical protein